MPEKIFGTLDPFYESGPFLGRIAANTGFLEALLQLDPFDKYHFFVSSGKVASNCRWYLKNKFPSRLSKVSFYPRLDIIKFLGEHSYHVFHLSDCINHPAHLARLRNKCSRTIFPITSITHSLSYADYSHQLLKQLWPGWSIKDAIICSSECAREVLGKYFTHLQSSYRLGNDFKPPRLEQIPLGINYKEIDSSTEDEDTQKNQFDKKKVNILCLGRISSYSKMDILPILKSLQLAKIYGLNLNTIRLILAGGLDRKDDTVKKLSLFARNIGLETMVFPNPGHSMKVKLLRDSDIFISLADNPQETFGLTILEAQAAGLPVIASDYNGYKELITHAENGFLVPTLGPDSTDYIDDLAPLVYDSESHLLLAQNCAVDIHALAGTLTRLISSPELRVAVARKGRQSAKQYDWPGIIKRYTDLWDQLNLEDDDRHLQEIRHPVHTPYADIFSGHTTDSWINSVVCLGKLGQAVYRKKDFPVIYSGISHLVTPDRIRMLLFLSRAPLKSSALIARLCAALDIEPSTARMLLAWSVKQGLLQTS
ncbi:MAG: glycosyltransferase family 4 protein [Desulfonatronovibrio sp.]